MKIALVTIHNANNYGAVFQAFALQEVLSRYGAVKIVNYNNRHISRSFDIIRFVPTLHGVLGAGKDVLRLVPRCVAIKKFKSFINRKMKLTEEFTSQSVATKDLSGFDCYVAGSDQIWNPACVSSRGELDPVYFLDFAPVGAKKLSFASSLGAYQFSQQEKVELKSYLGGFHMISVREKGAQQLLEEVLERKVNHVLDPTLLLSKEEWLQSVELDDCREKQEKYILLYTVPKAPLVRQAVEFFSKKLNLRVVAIDQGLSAGAKVHQQLRDAGPEDFLKMFANAEFVITDSFHGVCFSLNFGKPFIAISPGKYVNRIDSLLSLMGLKERIVEHSDGFEGFDTEVDFSEAHEKLERARKDSIKILSDALLS